MSHRLISRSAEFRQLQESADLKQLQDDGYEVEVRDGNLFVGHVPFRNSAGEVAFGTLVCPLEVAGNVTARPADHVVRLIGGVPYSAEGLKWEAIIADEQPLAVSGQTTAATLSQKPLDDPERRYRDYHHKMTTYVAILATPARLIDPDATAQSYPVIVDDGGDALFHYVDTASSRAGITEAAAKLKVGAVAIVGLGGTGSYLLDFLAKAPIENIHIFDGDRFLQHNAFRSPGAPSLEELQEGLSKVAWFHRIYSRMRRQIHVHEHYVDESNVDELRAMDFVFIAADSGKAKRLIVERLQEWGIGFIDVGMGLWDNDSSIGGQLRVTTSTPEFHEHVAANRRISFADEADVEGDADANIYSFNIQIAELNALNAALAVIKWKKICGFYFDDEYEHHSLYVVSGNTMINEDRAA